MSTGTDSLHRPAFLTPAQCQDWLSGAPLTNPVQAQAMFLRQINLLNREDLPGADRLSILELLREPLHATQEDASRRFSGKPLPLAPAEQSAYETSHSLWRTLASGYARCTEAVLAGDSTLRASAALALQRSLAALVEELLDAHRAGQQLAPDFWQLAHRVFATAEHCHVAQQEVMDPQRSGKAPCSPSITYAEAVLLQAGNLHELPPRQIGWVANWARRWAAKLQLFDSPPTLSMRAIPLCVDLESDKPGGYRPLAGAGARWFGTAELGHSLKKRLVLLAQGEPPVKLHLGEDCTQPACEQLLTAIYQRWCKGGAMRRSERQPTGGMCRFIVGIDGVHYYLSGRKSVQPLSPTTELLRKERDELATFGQIASRRDERISEQQGYRIEEWEVLENWDLIDASATGIRLARPMRQDGARIGHGLLIAVSTHADSAFSLGCVRWAQIADADSIQTGVRLFPGQPEALALRMVEVSGDKSRPGFLLPALAEPPSPASIVMPIGLYKRDRVLEASGSLGRKLRLRALLERGTDFERAAFEFV